MSRDINRLESLHDLNVHAVYVVLAMQRSGDARFHRHIPAMLEHHDPAVRFAAMRWIADAALHQFTPHLQRIAESPQNLDDFLASLAALDHLAGRPPAARPGPAPLWRMVNNADASSQLRSAALRLIPPDYRPMTVPRLTALLDDTDDAALQIELLRTLAHHRDEARFERLLAVARDASQPQTHRAQAILGLAHDAWRFRHDLIELALNESPPLRDEALRALVPFWVIERVVELRALGKHDPSAVDAVTRLLGGPYNAPPNSRDVAEWLAWIEPHKGGDAEAGERIFFHPTLALCGSCHVVDGRGKTVGPDLSRVGGDAASLLQRIIDPHRNVPFHYQLWIVRTDDGQTHTGFFRRERGDGTEIYTDAAGQNFTLPRERIVSREQVAQSVMPPGLLQILTPREVRDLLAFLRR